MNITKVRISLLFLLVLARLLCIGQESEFDRELQIANADYGTCYTIGNYMLCPEQNLIRVGKMFGTATEDCFGYFPDSTLKYDQDTLIIFGSLVFFDKSNLNINWNTVQLLSLRGNYVSFTDGKSLFQVSENRVRKISENGDYTFSPDIEKKLPYRNNNELSEGFFVKGDTFYFNDKPIIDSFDVSNLHTNVSKRGYETNYLSDGKRIIFGGGKTGYSTIVKYGREYVLATRWIVESVDLQSLRVLGRDILIDNKALYYCGFVIPLEKLNGLKIIIREID